MRNSSTRRRLTLPKYRLQLIEMPDAPPKRFSWVRGAMLCNLDVPEGRVLPLIAAAVALLQKEGA